MINFGPTQADRQRVLDLPAPVALEVLEVKLARARIIKDEKAIADWQELIESVRIIGKADGTITD